MSGALTVANLLVNIGADTKALDSGLSAASAKVEGFGGKLSGIAGTVAGFATTAGIAGIAAIGAGFAGAVSAASDFESTMSGVKAVSGATAGEMSGLSQLALQLGKDTSFSASEAGKGIEELVKGGLSIPDIMNGAAKSTLDLAAAGGISLPDAATIAANAMAQFGLKGEDMAHVADLIAGAANASALDVGQFKYSLQAAGAVANTVGFSFDDLAQGIAIMGKAGITGSDAGTSLKTMMMSLVPSTDKAKNLMKELGIVTADGANRFFDASGKVKSMAEVAEILQESTEGLTQAQKLQALETLFGSDAIRAAAVLAKEGSEGFNEMAASMGKVTAESVGAEKLNNLSGSWQQLTGSIETLGITFGLSFLPLLKRATDGLTGFVNVLIPIAEKWAPIIADAVVGTFEQIAGAVTDLYTIFTEQSTTGTLEGLLSRLGLSEDTVIAITDTIGNFAMVIRDQVLPFVSQLGGAISGLFAIFSGSSSMEGLAATATALTNLFGPAATSMILDFTALLGDGFREVSGFIVGQLGTVVGWVQENWPLIQRTFATVVAAIAAAWEKHGAQIVFVVKSAWTIVSTLIDMGIRDVLDVLKLGMQVITGDWSGAWDTVTSAFARKVGQWGTIFGAATDAILVIVDDATGGAITTVQEWMTDTAQAIAEGMDAVSDTVSAGWNAVKGFIPGVLNGIRSAILAVWNLIPEDIRTDLQKIAMAIVTNGATWMTNITTAGQNMLTAITTKLGEMVTAVTTWATSTFLTPITSLAGTAGTAATNVGSGMMTAITGKLGEIVGAVTTWADSTFLAPLRGLVETARGIAASIGQAIIDGVSGAINAGASALSGAIGSAVRGALQSAKDALGIESPSKRFHREVGQQMMLGAIGGINAQQPALMLATKAAMVPAVDVAAGVVSSLSQQAVAMAEAARQAAMAASKAKSLRTVADIMKDLGKTIGRPLELPTPIFGPRPDEMGWHGDRPLPDPIFRPFADGGGFGGGDVTYLTVNVNVGNAIVDKEDLATAVVIGLQHAERTGRTRLRVIGT